MRTLIVALGALALGTVTILTAVAGETEAPAVGKVAASFKTESLAGKKLKFPESYKGKVVLLDFWATWCPPCRAEIPHLVEAYTKYQKKGFEIVGVTLDKPRSISKSQVESFLETNKMKWQQVYDDAADISKEYHVTGIPAPFLVDGDTGKILAMGGELRGDKLHESIEKHLKAKRASESTPGQE